MIGRPCLEPGCPRLATQGPRCEGHRLNRERARNQRREGAKTWGRRRLRSRVNRAGGALCAHCGAWHPAHAIRIDHRIPLADGGTDTDNNVQPLCVDCHDTKTTAEHQTRTTRRH